MYRDDINIRMY